MAQLKKNDRRSGRVGYMHVSAYRVLYVLKQLISHRALSYAEINQFMVEHSEIGRVFGAETVTKYINTLRQFGCEIPKANGSQGFKYRLLKSPFLIDVTPEEVKTLLSINRILANHSNSQVHVQFLKFFEDVLWSARLPKTYAEQPISALIDSDSLSHVGGRVAQLRRFQRWCRERQALMVHYGSSISDLRVYYVDVLDVIQDGQTPYVLGYDRESMQQVHLNIHQIQQVRQLPCKVQNRLKWVNIQFQLTGRLAKTYRLYPGEVISSSSRDKDGEVHRLMVRAKTLEPEKLLNRLMKYGTFCEVLSPQYIRQKMALRIERLSQLYESVPLGQPPNILLGHNDEFVNRLLSN